MIEDGSVEESPTTPPLLCCSEDEPDDAELVHSAAGRCSDDEPLSALKPEGAEQPQGDPPQLEESQRHEVSLSSREEFLHQFEGYLALYGARFVPPEGAEQPQGERPLDELGDSQLHESQGHEVSQVDPEASQQLELEDELKAMLESTPELDGDESQGHEESQLDTEPSMPNETFRAQYTRLSQREPEPRCL